MTQAQGPGLPSLTGLQDTGMDTQGADTRITVLHTYRPWTYTVTGLLPWYGLLMHGPTVS